MAASVTKILLGKVFTKEENEFRMLILGEKGFFWCVYVCHEAVAIKSDLLLIYLS